MLNTAEYVPFRLTPNIQNFFSQITIAGIFTCAMTASAQALQDNFAKLEAALSLFLRDDLFCCKFGLNRDKIEVFLSLSSCTPPL